MNNRKGFTLVELLLILALIGIVLSMVFSSIIFSFKNFDKQNEKTNIISDARSTMDYLTREIRKAAVVEINDGSLNKTNNLVIDSKKYKLDNMVLYKDNQKIIEGIDAIFIEQQDKRITIKISIGEYELTSDINLR